MGIFSRGCALCYRSITYRPYEAHPRKNTCSLRCFGRDSRSGSLYQPLVDFAGAGASVPLTGFGNLLAKGMKKAVEDDGLLGIFTGGFTACSAGVTAAMIFALAVSLIFNRTDRTRQE